MIRTTAFLALGLAGALSGALAVRAGPDGADRGAALEGLAFENVSISVADLDRSAAWYRDALGFREIRQGEFPSVGARFAMLEGLGMKIELITAGKATAPDKGATPPEHLRTTGYKTLVLRTSKLGELTRYLERKGVSIVWKEQKLAGDLSSTMFHDLDGNLINVFGRAGGH